MATMLWSFALYYLILFVVCFIVVEFGQSYFYDEATAAKGLKVTFGSLLLAVMLTYTHSDFGTMFTSQIMWTVLQSILWIGVFILIFRFHPWHGLAVGMGTMLIITGLSTLCVDSMLTPRNYNQLDTSKPVRKPIQRAASNPAPGPDAKAKPEGKPAAK